MRISLHKKGERLSIIALLFIGISLIIFSIRSVDNTYESASRMTWQQSTEQQLQQQNESYYNEFYDRYSRITNDLTNYQLNTNRRLDSLESRVEQLEKRVQRIYQNVEVIENEKSGS